MSGQRSSREGGDSASVEAGCFPRESRRHVEDNNEHGGFERCYGSGQVEGGSGAGDEEDRFRRSIGHTEEEEHQRQRWKVPIQSNNNFQNGGLAVFSWGRGEDGQLGIGDTSDQDEPTYVSALRGVSVSNIACGSGHTVVLTSDGKVYTWGRGDDGRLGHGDGGWKYVPRSSCSLEGLRIVQVTCGSYHTAAVASNGDLYTWGGGMYGKLGHGNEFGNSSPRRVDGLVGTPVVMVACGSRHTACIGGNGSCYAWGDRENGVAGHTSGTGAHQRTPKLLERLAGRRVTGLSACGFHTGCITDRREVWTWGEGKFGRLGHGAERNCHGPQLVENLLWDPKQIACGGFHTAVVTSDGTVYTFGGGEHGQLGHGDKTNRVRPTAIMALEGTQIVSVTCGWSHSVALDVNGRVFTWGNGDHGKLGHGSGEKMSTPHLVDGLSHLRVIRIASYNEHTAALVEPPEHGVVGAGCGDFASVAPRFLRDLTRMVDNPEYADIVFLLGEDMEKVHAHRSVLASRCEHFAAMFRSGMRESIEREIPIPDMSKAVFLHLMEYLYTDFVRVGPEYAVELHRAADLYRLTDLSETCRSVVRRNLDSTNAAVLLQAAEDTCCTEIKEVCMEYVVNNFDVVSKGDGIRTVSHGLLLEILEKRP